MIKGVRFFFLTLTSCLRGRAVCRMALKGSFAALAVWSLAACSNDRTKRDKNAALLQKQERDYIKKISGEDDSISAETVRRGEVLIAYSDCYTCHREDKRAKGPAFRDIAARYPVQDMYIKMLAGRVIAGGSGAWGYAVMSPHPGLSNEDAETMVSYILSLDTLK